MEFKKKLIYILQNCSLLPWAHVYIYTYSKLHSFLGEQRMCILSLSETGKNSG